MMESPMQKQLPNKLLRLIISVGILLPAILLGSGCSLFSEKEDIDPNDTTRSLVFGYFDIEDTPSWGGIDWVSIKQFKPKINYYTTDFHEGVFFHVGLPNDSAIQVDRFGRGTRWYSNATYTYNFGGQGKNETGTHINKPGVYFLGAYKYKHHNSGSLFKADSFEMVKTDAPSEKEVLQRVLKMMQEDSELAIYTHQIAMIQARLKRLK